MASTAGREGGSRLTPPAVDAIERNVAEIKQGERRTQDSLEAVQGTVEHVVDRLATIESDLHRDATARAAPAAQSPTTAPDAGAGTHAARIRAATAAHRRRQAPAGTRTARQRLEPPLRGRRSIPACRRIIRWNPAPQPAAPARGASAADRIAASEAAIGSAKPPVIADPGRTNFIAAARRAAQAAAWGQPDHQRSGEAAREGRDAKPNKLSQRLRKLIVAGAAVLIVVGCLHIASRLFDDWRLGCRPAGAVGKAIAARRLDARSQSAGAGAARGGPAPGAKPDARHTAERSTPGDQGCKTGTTVNVA